MAELRTLLESLRRGETPSLAVADVDELVGWLLGKSEASADLPKPEHDPVLQQMVFYRLDATLFSSGELRLAPAGLGPGEPAKLRKTRFRRLAGAFHPDRHPDLADWLTERSQAVLRAYGRFKHGDEAPETVMRPAPPYPGYPPPRPPQRGPFRSSRRRLRAAAEALRRRFGNDRFLPHKLIGGLALLALLPVLNLLLVPKPDRFDAIDNSAGTAGSYSGPEVSAGAAAAKSEPEVSGGAAGSLTELTVAPLAADDAGADSALLVAARQAMRLHDAESGPLPSVDEQLAAMGLDTDTERLYRRIRAGARAGADSRVRSIAAEPVRDPGLDPPATSPTDPAPTAARTRPARVAAESVRAPDPDPPATSPTDSAPTASITRPTPVGAESVRDPSPQPTAPTLAASELTLGLLGAQPQGAVLRAYAGAVESGDLGALMAQFDRQARHGVLRGSAPIKRHYQALFESHSPRRVMLKVLRAERNGPRWAIEAELLIEGLQSGRLVAARQGRVTFTLAGSPLQIQRLEF
ncbi:MAG: hypothetical protein GW900_03085 [Gammaproteobacteria bacterium]|nr:hypothetical protein [Gammaproteobacteria bacterium]